MHMHMHMHMSCTCAHTHTHTYRHMHMHMHMHIRVHVAGEPPIIGRLGSALCSVPDEHGVESSGRLLILGGSAKGAVLDEALLLDTDCWSLIRVPPPPPPGTTTSATSSAAPAASAASAGGASGPWARAHGALLALPQLALHVGGAKSSAAPPCDALDLQTMSWREIEIDAKSAALLGACRLKHGLARTTYRTALDGGVTATALLYGGEFPPAASPGAAGQSPARFCRVRVREMAGAATPETSSPKVSSAVAYAASRARAACAEPSTVAMSSTVAPPSAPSAPPAPPAPSAPPAPPSSALRRASLD